MSIVSIVRCEHPYVQDYPSSKHFDTCHSPDDNIFDDSDSDSSNEAMSAKIIEGGINIRDGLQNVQIPAWKM